MRRAKRKPPSGGLTPAQLKAKAKARRGVPLTKKHKAAISKGLQRSAAKRHGMTLSQYLKKKSKG